MSAKAHRSLAVTFAMSPAAGWLYDLSGSYELAFVTLIAICLLAAATFLGINHYLARRGASKYWASPNGLGSRAEPR